MTRSSLDNIDRTATRLCHSGNGGRYIPMSTALLEELGWQHGDALIAAVMNGSYLRVISLSKYYSERLEEDRRRRHHGVSAPTTEGATFVPFATTRVVQTGHHLQLRLPKPLFHQLQWEHGLELLVLIQAERSIHIVTLEGYIAQLIEDDRRAYPNGVVGAIA